MIANEIYKKFKNKIINKKQIEDVFNYKSDNFDKVNFTHTSLLNRTNNNINPINFNKSNINFTWIKSRVSVKHGFWNDFENCKSLTRR